MAIVLIDKRLLPSGNTISRLIQQHVRMGYIGENVEIVQIVL